MEYAIHHTCSKQGGKEKVLNEFPFLSEYNPNKGQQPFLGEGYYFWDFNLDYAKVWGRNHYTNDFYICEANIDIEETDGYFLDLAGNRKHLVGFIELLWEFNLIHKEGTEGIDLCWIINYLRTKCPPEVFPFKVIRAVDYKNDERAGIKVVFNDKQKSYTILNPRIIFSFREKEDIVYKNEPFICFES